jgi:hypothetical protein
MMKGHSFSTLYWRSVHMALNDLVRQRGNPSVYYTLTPYEYTMPYHELLRHDMEKAQRIRTKMAVFETLHAAHVLTQTATGVLTGANKRNRGCWTRQIIPNSGKASEVHEVGTPSEDDDDEDEPPALIPVHRLEFQDGSRKDPTQSYHGSGRVHLHGLIFGNNLERMCLHESVMASLPPESEIELRAYVLSGQLDNKGSTPWKIFEGPSCWDPKTKTCRLHHTEEDHRRGVRAFFVDVLEALKGNHQDVQLANDEGCLHAYVAKYISKFTDSLLEDCLNDDGEGDEVAASVLARYKPYEPEMVLQLFGGRFRQWYLGTKSGGKKEFVVPTPDHLPMPKDVTNYINCQWKGAHMTLLDYLRKVNDEGEIHHWLEVKHDSLVLREAYNAYLWKGPGNTNNKVLPRREFYAAVKKQRKA